MRFAACFLDLDGVINDPAVLPGVWQAHFGDILAPAIGGTVADWGRANTVVFPRIWEEQRRWGPDPAERRRLEAVGVITGMCAELGFAPPSEDVCLELQRRAEIHIALTGKTAFPGIASAVRELAGMLPLHMATGNASWRVEATLGVLGVRELIGFPAGPDLVGIFKSDPLFYARIFERTGVRPEDALVVDDGPPWLGLAAGLGAATVHIDNAGGCECLADTHIARLAELPERLAAGEW